MKISITYSSITGNTKLLVELSKININIDYDNLTHHNIKDLDNVKCWIKEILIEKRGNYIEERSNI